MSSQRLHLKMASFADDANYTIAKQLIFRAIESACFLTIYTCIIFSGSLEGGFATSDCSYIIRKPWKSELGLNSTTRNSKANITQRVDVIEPR